MYMCRILPWFVYVAKRAVYLIQDSNYSRIQRTRLPLTTSGSASRMCTTDSCGGRAGGSKWQSVKGKEGGWRTEEISVHHFR